MGDRLTVVTSRFERDDRGSNPCPPAFADIAQSVARNLAKVEVAGSTPAVRLW